MTDENSDVPSGAEPAPTPESSNVRSPGAMIRAARERARISVEDLASQIKLARHTLEALERDDFNQLLEPVYVHGYYRKCAKVLGLPEQELIEAYRTRAMPRSPAAPSKLRLASGSELGTDNRLPVPMAVAAALLASFFCMFIWNMLKNRSEEPVPIAVTVQPPVMPLPEPGALPSTDVPAVPLAPVDPTAAAPSADGSTPAPAATSAAVTAAAPADAPVPATPAAAPGPDGAVTLAFSNTSWVRVDDSTGATLLNGLFHAGDTRGINGKLPFVVFLGNGPAVTVEFEGKPVDFSERVGENLTARFTVPGGRKP